MLYNKNPWYNTTTIKIKPADLNVVKKIYQEYFPVIPFSYSFFDEMIGKYYEKDRITMSLFNKFTLLSILVSCLGLYGLVSLITVQRTKEIGVRKVLGATINQLVLLMSKDFLKLVIWSLFIALPAAGFAMYKWLNNYAYHIRLSWWMFLTPAIVVTFIAIVVISKEIIRAALANPVKSLRSE